MSPTPGTGPPEALLDAFRLHPEWDDRRRDEQLRRLIAGHPPERLHALVLGRLDDLGGAGGEAVLRLVETLATPELLAAMAGALVAQPDLAPDRAWEALALLDDAGMLADYPELAGRWDELNEVLDEEGSLDQLAAQIEDDPEGLWLALQGLSAVEPDVRAAIITGLAELPSPAGPNLVEFFRLLGFAHDPATRAAALDALAAADGDGDDAKLNAAWASLAANHPDPEVAARARRFELARRDERQGAITQGTGTLQAGPKVARSLVTAIDGQGRATVALSSKLGADRVSAAFLCDVRGGVREVFGQTGTDAEEADAFLEEIAGQADRDYLLDVPGLAEGLLRGCLLLCDPTTTPALRYWIERVLGPDVTPHPFPIPFPDWDPASLVPEEMAGRAEMVLAACPSWIDSSALTYDMAEEVLLREGDSPPDARRDAGAYRYLFEHHLGGQLELYRRLLLWMALFWQASGEHELGRSALALASQLSDEQHAVPGHPFTVALTSRSLAAAHANLRAGLDPRGRS